MRRSDLPGELEFGDNVPGDDTEFILNGGSAVIGPDGQYVAGPAFGSEVIILARINLERIREESLTLDVTGHFNRPDLFDFRFKGAGQPMESEGAEIISAHNTDELIHTATEVLLPSGTEALSGADSPPPFRVITSSRSSSYDSAGYDSEGLGLEKQQRSQS